MDQQQKLQLLDQLEKNAEEEFFQQLQLIASVVNVAPALQDFLNLYISDSLGQEIMAGRERGVTTNEIRAALVVAEGNARSRHRVTKVRTV